MTSTFSCELCPAGFEFFQDSESFLTELDDARETDCLSGTSATLVVSIGNGLHGLNLEFDTRNEN